LHLEKYISIILYLSLISGLQVGPSNLCFKQD
jgi:hypothetical protein